MVAIFGKKKLWLQTACVQYQLGLLLFNMTKHDNTATFCEIRNCVNILLGIVSHRVSTVYGFWWNIVIVIVLVYAVGGYWIITYIKKILQYNCVHDKAYFSFLFGSEYIVNGYHIWKWQFFGCCKYVIGLLWHSSIWNFLLKNKEKNQAHEELI